MEHYTFQINRKYSVWEQETHEIEADTQEEANQKMIELFKNSSRDYDYDVLDTFIETETLFDTMDQMTPDDNDGQYTAELLTDGHDILATNVE